MIFVLICFFPLLPKMKKEIINKHLTEVSSFLSLYGENIGNVGLLHGKMGIALFFAHYASFTQEEKYNRFANELIEELVSQLLLVYSLDNDNEIFAFNYENGLPGIGIGIAYLVEQGLMEADLDDVLDDMDMMLAKRITGKIIPLSLMLDIGKYFLVRLSNPQTCKRDFLDQTMEQILQLINNYLQINPLQIPEIFNFLNELSKQYTHPVLSSLLNRQFITPKTTKIEGRNVVSYNNIIEELLNQPGKNIYCFNLGIGGLLNGYAGLGLSLLSMLDPRRHSSWLNLL